MFRVRTRSPVALMLGIVTLILIVSLVLALASESGVTGQAAIVGVVGMVVGLLSVALFGVQVHPLSMFAIYSYGHAVVFILRPVYNAVSQEGANIFVGGPVPEIVSAAWISTIGYISVCVGYGIRAHGKRFPQPTDRVEVKALDTSQWRFLLPVIAIVYVTGFGLYSVYVNQVGGLGAFLSLNSGRSVELTEALAGSSGYYISGLLMTNGVSVLLICQGLAARRRGTVALGVTLLIVGCLPQLMTGSRSVFVPLGVALLLCVIRLRPGVVTPLRAIVFGLPIFVIAFVAPRILRSEADNYSSGWTALGAAFAPQSILEGFIGGYDTAMLDAFALQVRAQELGQLAWTTGSTYLAAILSPVPRAVWQSKPVAVDTYLNEQLFPVTAAQKIGFSFGLYSEPYLNLGVAGVVIVMILFGIVLASLDPLLFGPTSIFAFVCVALSAGALFPIVRGSISFDVQRLIIPLVPILLLYLLHRAQVRRNLKVERGRLVSFPT